MGELKPCPFCGGDATLRDDTSHSTAVFIGCETIGCFGHYQWDETEADAIAAWNKRATTAAPTFTAADLEREVSIQEAAKVILTALERAQIDMEILRMFFNGQPRSALEALSSPPADLAQRVKKGPAHD